MLESAPLEEPLLAVRVPNPLPNTPPVGSSWSNPFAGGIIVPDLHYGRDALIGIALFLTHLAKSKKTIRQLRNTYPDYFISKNKIELSNGTDVKTIFENIKDMYKNQPVNDEDGLKIEFDNDWVHLRTSNTEPIIRIYAESDFESKADNIAKKLMQDIGKMM